MDDRRNFGNSRSITGCSASSMFWSKTACAGSGSRRWRSCSSAGGPPSSAQTLRRVKLKLERSCCSSVPVTRKSAFDPSTRGSRNCADHAVLRQVEAARIGDNAAVADDPVEFCGCRLALVKRLTDRFLPNRLRRPISNNARGRELELLRRHRRLFRRPDDARPHLEAAAVAERRRRRFLDRHEHVARRLVAVAQLRDPRAAEQPERGQPPLALVDRLPGRADRPP